MEDDYLYGRVVVRSGVAGYDKVGSFGCLLLSGVFVFFRHPALPLSEHLAPVSFEPAAQPLFARGLHPNYVVQIVEELSSPGRDSLDYQKASDREPPWCSRNLGYPV